VASAGCDRPLENIISITFDDDSCKGGLALTRMIRVGEAISLAVGVN
jgi:hypothetical protein